jgi:serine/threonine-protein kinase RsbW
LERKIIRLELAGELEHRDVALRTVTAACRVALGPRCDAPESREMLDQVISAVGEAFNNIVVHGYKDRTAGVIEVEIAINRKQMAIEMRDYGRSFDPRNAPAPDLDALPESGMGVYIMKGFMDRVDYRPGSRPGNPNVLRLVKKLA